MTESRTRTTNMSGNVAREVPAEPISGEGATRVAQHETVHRAEAPARRDRVRWGPVWAGLIAAVPTFLLLQVITLALGWWDVGGADASNAGWISGVNGLIAFFLGGLTAGATAIWRGFSEGLLHGILVWALGVVTIVFLTLFGGGALFGSLADVVTQVGGISQADLPEVQAAEAADIGRSAAAWASLALGLSIIASALGGVLGAKMWPGRKDEDHVDHRVAA